MVKFRRLYGKGAVGLGFCWKESNRPGKNGDKTQCANGQIGLLLTVVLSGTNTHDIKLLEETLDHIVTLRLKPDVEHPQNLCLDAGYTGNQEKWSSVGIFPIFGLVVRKRRSWSVILTSMPAAGLLR